MLFVVKERVLLFFLAPPLYFYDVNLNLTVEDRE